MVQLLNNLKKFLYQIIEIVEDIVDFCIRLWRVDDVIKQIMTKGLMF